jgi:hypothetical protein
MWMNEMHIGACRWRDSMPRLSVLALSFLLKVQKKRCVLLVRVLLLSFFRCMRVVFLLCAILV